MAKGGGRKVSDKEKSRASSPAFALSAEDAERASLEFIPIWQLDDAPFTAPSAATHADLGSLAGASTSAVTLLGPAPVLGAVGIQPVADAGISTATIRMTAPADMALGDAPLESGLAEPNDADLASRATIRMTPALHQPVPAREKEPSLPSVIVEQSDPGLAAVPAPASVRAPIEAAPPVEPAAPASVRAPLREPKTDPPAARARSAPTIATRRDRPASGGGSAYRAPQKRNPVVIGSLVIGAGAIALGLYFMSSTPTAPEPVAPVTHIVPPQPQVAIPAIPAVDDTPPVAQPTPSPAEPPIPTAPPAPAVPVVPPTPSPTPPPFPPPAVSPSPAPPHTPRASSNPVPTPKAPAAPRPPTSKTSSPPTPGGIVRDNPF